MLCAWHWGIGRALDLVGTGAQQTGSGDVECWLEQWWALVESWLWAASSAHMTPLAFLDARSPCVPAPPAPAAQREPSGLMAAVQPSRGSGGDRSREQYVQTCCCGQLMAPEHLHCPLSPPPQVSRSRSAAQLAWRGGPLPVAQRSASPSTLRVTLAKKRQGDSARFARFRPLPPTRSPSLPQ